MRKKMDSLLAGSVKALVLISGVCLAFEVCANDEDRMVVCRSVERQGGRVETFAIQKSLCVDRDDETRRVLGHISTLEEVTEQMKSISTTKAEIANILEAVKRDLSASVDSAVRRVPARVLAKESTDQLKHQIRNELKREIREELLKELRQR